MTRRHPHASRRRAKATLSVTQEICYILAGQSSGGMLHISCRSVRRQERRMMPVIRLSDAAFSELKTIATWLSTKTPSETIDRLVREKLDELGLERDSGDEPEIA